MTEDLTALNRQALDSAKQYMGRTGWGSIILVVIALAGTFMTLSLYTQGELSSWVALLLIAVFTYFAYTPLHEAVHGNIHGDKQPLKWLNELCGYLVAPLISIPFTSHKKEHMVHHRYTNQGKKDPDFMVSAMAKGPVAAIVTVLHFLWLQNSYYVTHYWKDAEIFERFIYCIEVFISIGWRAVFIAYFPTIETAFVIILGYLIGGFFTAYWFAFRPHMPYQDSARYRNTNAMILPVWMKPLEWFWLGQNLHVIHHLFPRVPFYCYPKLFREIEPILRAQGTPIIGIYSREPLELK